MKWYLTLSQIGKDFKEEEYEMNKWFGIPRLWRKLSLKLQLLQNPERWHDVIVFVFCSEIMLIGLFTLILISIGVWGHRSFMYDIKIHGGQMVYVAVSELIHWIGWIRDNDWNRGMWTSSNSVRTVLMGNATVN